MDYNTIIMTGSSYRIGRIICHFLVADIECNHKNVYIFYIKKIHIDLCCGNMYVYDSV